MYMNEKVLINYVKNEHLTDFFFLGKRLGFFSIKRRHRLNINISCVHYGPACDYIHQMIK